MTSTGTRNLSALRASIKHEDAALENRLPTTKAGAITPSPAAPAAAPAPKPAPRKTAVSPPARSGSAAAAATTTAKPALASAARKPANTPTGAKPAVPKPAPAVELPPTKADALKPQATSPAGKHAKALAARKAKSDKLVRDSFELLQSEHAQIKSLRSRLAATGVKCTKSGVLRAALANLLTLDAAALVTLAQTFAKTSKPKRGKKG